MWQNLFRSQIILTQIIAVKQITKIARMKMICFCMIKYYTILTACNTQ